PGDCANELKVSQICARDQQHKTCESKCELHYGSADVVGHGSLKRLESQAFTFVRGVLLMDVSGERNHTLLCLLDGDAGLEPAKGREKAGAAIRFLFRSEGQRLPGVDRSPKHRMIEPGRHHADYLHGFSVELNFSTDDARITSKTPRPTTIAQDDHVINTRLKFFGFKYTAVGGLDSHQREEIRGCCEVDQALGCLPVFGESTASIGVGRHPFKNGILGALVEEICH